MEICPSWKEFRETKKAELISDLSFSDRAIFPRKTRHFASPSHGGVGFIQGRNTKASKRHTDLLKAQMGTLWISLLMTASKRLELVVKLPNCKD